MGTLRIKTSVVENMWNLEMELVQEQGSTLPRDIFLYENTGSGLGEYVGVCSLQDFRKYQAHQVGVNIAVFGNKYIKHTVGLLKFNIERDPQPIKDKIIADVKAFKQTYNLGQSSTSTHMI